MNKKVIASTLAISALAVNVFAQGSNLGPNGTANGDASLIIGTNNTTTTNATSALHRGHSKYSICSKRHRLWH